MSRLFAKASTIGVIALIHGGCSIFIFFNVLQTGVRRLGTPLTPWEDFVGRVGQVLLYPVIPIWPFKTGLLSSVIPFVLNSLVWAVGIYIVAACLTRSR